MAKNKIKNKVEIKPKEKNIYVTFRFKDTEILCTEIIAALEDKFGQLSRVTIEESSSNYDY